MEQEKQAVMPDQLPKHILALRDKMTVMGYSKHVMERSGRVWDALLDYSKKHDVALFSPAYCHAFRNKRYEEYYSDKHAFHCINKPLTLLLDFIRLGVVIRQKNNKTKEFYVHYPYNSILHFVFEYKVIFIFSKERIIYHEQRKNKQ